MAAAMMLLLCSVLGAPKRIDSYFKKLEPPIRAALPPSAAPPLPDDFTYALPLGISDNHSWLGFSQKVPTVQMAFPSLQNQPRRHANLSEYCRLGRASRWWRQIALQAPPRSLSRDEVVFSLLTTDRSSIPQRGAQRGRASPGASAHLKKELARAEQRPAANTLRLQGARLHRFTNVGGADSTLLPRSAVDERAHGRAYMGQKQLEMIMAMRPHSLPPAPPRAGGSQVAVRWWVVCDDDSFVFVDRYTSLLASLSV